MTTHYDIIPDIHADIDRLTQTLSTLGYVAAGDAWGHPERRIAAFLGDCIDTGRDNWAVCTGQPRAASRELLRLRTPTISP